MGLIGAVSPVFRLFSQLYECLPVAVKLLIVGTVGIFLLVGLFKLLGE